MTFTSLFFAIVFAVLTLAAIRLIGFVALALILGHLNRHELRRANTMSDPPDEESLARHRRWLDRLHNVDGGK